MPVIQQENGRKTVAGLPLRWGIRAYHELQKAQGNVLGVVPEKYKQLSALLDEVTDAPLPIDATDAQICILAQRCAEEAAKQANEETPIEFQQMKKGKLHTFTAFTMPVRARLEWLLKQRGIKPPKIEDDRQFILRACDAAFWRRNLRKTHGRTFEHAAIRLGLVSIKAGAYCSNESVARHREQKRRNRNLLASIKLQNQSTDQVFGLDELSDKTTSNETIRRGELMLRLSGCEEVANECGDTGLFITITCPSKYHAILVRSGELNPKYDGSTPRQAAEYLQTIWARIRTAYGKRGIRPYGFRIAEPHHDGCPHWHMLVFVKPGQVEALQDIITDYALREDGDEPGAQANRVDFEIMSADKGSACGYLAKYVSKNIGDEHVTDHIDSDGVITAAQDMTGDEVTKPHQRVQAWASVWGIKQFQPIGQPPVMGWREMRRVSYETVQHAPEFILDAWNAAQRIEAVDIGTGEKKVIQAANYAGYIRAQGGVCLGRKYRIGVATRQAEVEGRYGLALADVPVGIYAKAQPNAVYESTRYRWKRIGVAVAVAFPWSPVNNCTGEKNSNLAGPGFWAKNLPVPGLYEPPPEPDEEEMQRYRITEDQEIEFLTQAAIDAEHVRRNTKWTYGRIKSA